ncbi:MAG: hypothetical protein HW421_3445 [Ignavibacteria bacterium]|nr:hypothetical protein [Ignavibacteria bacterium]
MRDIQYLSDTKGKIKSVLVPLKLWESLVSESETRYIMKSNKMKSRLDESRSRKSYQKKEEVYEKLGI